MPELPEVETVRRGLAPAMERARFDSVRTARGDLRFAFPKDFTSRLEGATVEALGRRGKYLTAGLSTGETLIMHLGMSGRFTVSAGDGAARPGEFYDSTPTNPAHDHVEFLLSGPAGRARIVYNDPRRFGFMDLAATAGLASCRHFAGMGPEPLCNEFSAAGLSAALKGRASPIKAALLDQSVVAGLGNIYVCEALFRARVSPRRKAASVAGGRAERLAPAIRDILTEAIAAGGSSLKDFAASDGALGYFQHRFSVYDRAGAGCTACGAPIRRIVQSGRSTFYCGVCQR
ncbi:MAG: bifunctional DNA-formamidopyrimidine glycosylase/DNA-(apurinic or apyrimidinic site) lyase [Parvularculaceae bacterium]